MTLCCLKCENDLYPIKGLCTDRDRMREDQFCPECNIRYGLRSHGLVKLSQGANESAISQENQELKRTIAIMTGIKEEVAKTSFPIQDEHDSDSLDAPLFINQK